MRIVRILLRVVAALLALAVALLLVALVAAWVLPLPANPDRDPASFARADGRFLTVDGTRTYVEESGPKDGPAVVLVHGFGGSTYSWRYTRAALAAAGYRAIALDLRGFGLADKTWDGDYTHASQARLVLGVMDVLGVPTAVLVGHSMGANVVSHVALQAPGRVRALVLVDAAVVPPGSGGGGVIGGVPGAVASALLALPPVRRLGQFAIRLELGGAAERILRSAYADPTFPTAADVAAYGEAQQLADWDLALMGIVRDGSKNGLPAPAADLARGRPVLVAWGERDPWIPLSSGTALRDSIPGAGWLVVPGAGHLPMEEGHAAFEQGLLAFLRTLR